MNEVFNDQDGVRDLTDEQEMKCPTHEHLMDFVEKRLNPEQMTVIVGHLAVCAKCRDYVGFYSDLSVAEPPSVAADEECQLRRSLEAVKRRMNAWKSFYRQFEYQEVAAAADGYDAQGEVAKRAGFTVFKSKVREGKDAWTVVLPNLTGPVTAELELDFQVYDCDDNPVPSGVLTIGGFELPVVDGHAKLRGTRVQDEIEVSLRRGDGEAIPGDIDPDAGT